MVNHGIVSDESLKRWMTVSSYVPLLQKNKNKERDLMENLLSWGHNGDHVLGQGYDLLHREWIRRRERVGDSFRARNSLT